MMKLFKSALMLAALCAILGQVQAQESGSETRPVDERVVRIKLDGAIDLRLHQGSPASLKISGDKRYLENVTTVQSGDTLHIDSDMHGMRFGRAGMRADLVLPSLREVGSDGVGGAEISGFSGAALQLSLEGTGSMKVVCDYKKVDASLGGVGSLNIWVSDNDSVSLDLRGAGYITLGGHGKSLKATLGGLGDLNAQQFQADSVNVDLNGLGNATVTAIQNATLNLSGLGSVTVYGKPTNRNVSVDGLGKVSWK
ncbi:MAG TPA: DUF2807 domain-containing protein [Janthinobacterium sp.]|jgi:hypothetical protein|nr:DUF2807 domain-containing protein [Janthinobacterium sp.]